jgi:L-serine deaminase
MERGYMHGFVADFSDWAALQAYQDNAQHQAVGAKLSAASIGGKDGIVCFDLHMASSTTKGGAGR